MKFNWDNFTAEDFVNYCAMMENGMLKGDDYVGSVRVGALCFDLLTRVYKDKQMYLDYDLYVGGVDTGYGYSKENNYPYDYEGGSSFIDSCISMPYDEFKVYVEKELKVYLECEDKFYKHCSLIDKANEELTIW